MKEVKYKCNLCGEVKQPEDMKCMYWCSNIIPQRYVINGSLDNSDKHICLDCLEVVKKYFEGNPIN